MTEQNATDMAVGEPLNIVDEVWIQNEVGQKWHRAEACSGIVSANFGSDCGQVQFGLFWISRPRAEVPAHALCRSCIAREVGNG